MGQECVAHITYTDVSFQLMGTLGARELEKIGAGSLAHRGLGCIATAKSGRLGKARV